MSVASGWFSRIRGSNRRSDRIGGIGAALADVRNLAAGLKSSRPNSSKKWSRGVVPRISWPADGISRAYPSYLIDRFRLVTALSFPGVPHHEHSRFAAISSEPSFPDPLRRNSHLARSLFCKICCTTFTASRCIRSSENLKELISDRIVALLRDLDRRDPTTGRILSCIRKMSSVQCHPPRAALT